MRLGHQQHSSYRAISNHYRTRSSGLGTLRMSMRAAVSTADKEATQSQLRMEEEVHKPLCDRRSYRHAVLPNGLRVIAVEDKEAVFAAVCANVQVGYFDDPLPGAAHFLEHMVHLGSTPYPDDKEYKAFLAAHGGSSNASTGMVHTRYHFKVHSSALQGALARLGAALSSPLLTAECAAREVENVHAEYSRNTNSDSRKLLQLKRSFGEPPYSGFSTGSIKTLWEEPNAAGISVPDVLRELWGGCYTAPATTLAVVGPQEPQVLLQIVQEAFGSMTPGSNGSNSSAAGGWAAAGDLSNAPPPYSSSSSDVSSADEASETETESEGRVSGVPAAAPEAVLHSKAQQGVGAEVAVTPSGEEVCSHIADTPLQQHTTNHPQATPAGQQTHQQHGSPAAQGQQQQQQQRYPADVFGVGKGGGGGVLVRVCPQRELRELELLWYVPTGAMTHSSVKPWHLASHLLGHEVPGSVAHLLKAQGLVQSLSVGMGDEVRLGRGWMFWGATLQLTQEGEQQVEHVVATLFRGIQVLQCCSDDLLQQHWQEAAALAGLSFDWKDTTDPLACAQAAAYALHYYPHTQVLSGPALMTRYDVTPIRWFLSQLRADSMMVFWSSRRHQEVSTSKEPYYGAKYTAGPVPPSWLTAIQQYTAVDRGNSSSSGQQHGEQQQQFEPVPGQLHLPPKNWALPTDFTLRPQEQAAANADQAAAAAAPTTGAAAAAAVGGAAGVSGPDAGESGGVKAGPHSVVDQPGLCVWHQLDTQYGLPKVHLKLHIVTSAVYATPSATVCARLLVRVLDDLLLPLAYPAELAGTSYSLSTGTGGLLLKVQGFTGVAQQLMVEVLAALKGLTLCDVDQRFKTMCGRLSQGLTNWANNNPAQHSEYAAHHLLQQQHHHNRDLLEAVAAAQPTDIMQLQQQLISGGDMHLDMLCYGNISSSEAADIARRVHQLLPAQGLSPGSWPALGRVLSISPLRFSGDQGTECLKGEADTAAMQDAEAAAAAATGRESVQGNGKEASGRAVDEAQGGAGFSLTGFGPLCLTYLPNNPNPSNSNHAVYYRIQLGPDDVTSSVMSDLFVQLASKPAFHQLRTRQRLGYSVHLSSSNLQRQLGLVVRVQSPSTTPDAIAAAVRGWMEGFRGELDDLLRDKLDTHKQSLLDKYLEPAKSLREAAHRAWLPIGSSRTLVFDRRQLKAAALQDITQQQVMGWYDTHVSPTGPSHHALCVQVWGGAAGVPDQVLAALHAAAGTGGTGGGGSAVVEAGGVAAFKQAQQLLPLPAMQLPPAAAAAAHN